VGGTHEHSKVSFRVIDVDVEEFGPAESDTKERSGE
jgi:hypothetical protein